MKKFIMILVMVFSVTIAQATIVGNAGFESPEVDSSGIFAGVDSPWSPRGGSYGSQETYDPAKQITAYTNGVTEGNQAVCVTNSTANQLHWVWQYFALSSGSYTLTADIAAKAGTTDDFSGYRVEIVRSWTGEAYARDLNTLADSIIASKGDWITSSLNFDVPAGVDDGGTGQAYISLRLVAAAPVAGMTESAVCFDNVTLVPEPATLILLGIGSLTMLRKRK